VSLLFLLIISSADMVAYYASGETRFETRMSLIPFVGGWIALYKKYRK
jgi:hypothetical protein